MKSKLVSLFKLFLLSLLLSLSGNAHAEYYLVYNTSQCNFGCEAPRPVRHYYHPCHHHYHPKRHHTYHRTRSSVVMTTYYINESFAVWPPTGCVAARCGSDNQACAPCQRDPVPCRTSCRPCGRARYVNTCQTNDFNYDERTADDDREY